MHFIASFFILILILVKCLDCADKQSSKQGDESKETDLPSLEGLSLVPYSDSEEEDNFDVNETTETKSQTELKSNQQEETQQTQQQSAQSQPSQLLPQPTQIEQSGTYQHYGPPVFPPQPEPMLYFVPIPTSEPLPLPIQTVQPQPPQYYGPQQYHPGIQYVPYQTLQIPQPQVGPPLPYQPIPYQLPPQPIPYQPQPQHIPYQPQPQIVLAPPSQPMVQPQDVTSQGQIQDQAQETTDKPEEKGAVGESESVRNLRPITYLPKSTPPRFKDLRQKNLPPRHVKKQESKSSFVKLHGDKPTQPIEHKGTTQTPDKVQDQQTGDAAGSGDGQPPSDQPEQPSESGGAEGGDEPENPEDKEEGAVGGAKASLCEKITLMKKNSEGALIEMTEKEYKIIVDSRFKIKFRPFRNLEQVLCDGEIVYWHRSDKPYCSILSFNKKNNAFIIYRPGGFLLIKQKLGKWKPITAPNIPNYVKFYRQGSTGNEVEIVPLNYHLEFTSQASFKYTFKTDVHCSKMVVRNQVVWIKTASEGFPSSMSLTNLENVVILFKGYVRVFKKTPEGYRHLFIKSDAGYHED
ncbi:Tp15 [Theileria parva strain Muguga]|uniref:Theileria-specific sub-telomeric protein, SVSP family member n=1 Tax=Theileria parva TaxID=5875 RepID=Q4N136_THEPA|nr:Tp15 [Theileria parva strain Muguga]EAN32270.1 Tp15 [Theileria parva strain Muguga]|eukprot:XP_764553.1 hypothetical protein [Theileria parva strain Muguga]